MKYLVVLLTLLCLVSLGLLADQGKDLGEQASADGKYKVAGKVQEAGIYAKKSTSFDFAVQEGDTLITDAAVSMTFYMKVNGYLCPTDADVQVEKPAKCPKCQQDLQQGTIRKRVKTEVKLSCPKYNYAGKQVLDLVGEYDLDVKVAPVEGESVTVTFPLSVETWVAPKKHTCTMCAGVYPGPGFCKKCGMALVEKGEDVPKPKGGGHDPKKH